MEWKDIKTAPLDKCFLVYKPNAKKHKIISAWSYGVNGRICTNEGTTIHGATHWMALPQPPKGQS